MNNLTSRYASALLSLALEENKNEAYRSYLKMILSCIQDDTSLEKLLSCSNISKDEKKQIIDRVFINAPSVHIVSFIKVIIDNSRGRYLKPIIEDFISLSNERDGIIEGYIYSTQEMSKEDISKIEKVIANKLKKEVYLIPKIDQRLIGGFKVVINDYVFDASIKNKVDGLRSSLLERGS